MSCELHPEGCPRGAHNEIGEPGHFLDDGRAVQPPAPQVETPAAEPEEEPVTLENACPCGVKPAHTPEQHGKFIISEEQKLPSAEDLDVVAELQNAADATKEPEPEEPHGNE